MNSLYKKKHNVYLLISNLRLQIFIQNAYRLKLSIFCILKMSSPTKLRNKTLFIGDCVNVNSYKVYIKLGT